MDDGIGLEIAHQFVDNGLVGNRVDNDGQVRVVFQMLAPTGGEVVDRDHLVAAREEHFHHMGTNLAKAAGYEYFFHVRPPIADD
jgi:hypothetical protein